jgi:formate-dependent nitrite reductase membrane component NrfD
MIPTDSDTTALATYYDRPILKQPVWIWTVPAYFYVGGVAGAALVLGAVAQLTGDSELRRLVRTCRSIGAAGHVIGSALLIYDLGRPSRFFNMLRVFNVKSPLSSVSVRGFWQPEVWPRVSLRLLPSGSGSDA